MRDRRKMRQTPFGCTSTTHRHPGLTISTIALCTMLVGIALIPGCHSNKVAAPPPAITAGFGTTLEAVDTNDSRLPASVGRAIALSAAKNEWTSLALRIGNLPPPGPKLELRVGFSPAIPPQNISAYQV